MKLYVEGGGDTNFLKAECRRGFSAFLEKAGLKGSMPRIVACGGRKNAYDSFCTAVNARESAMLLVDSEESVSEECQQGGNTAWKPWRHLKNRDNWQQPANAADDDCHLMVQCMEAWFLADRKILAGFFGPGFREDALPAAGNSIESIGKTTLYQSLSNATKNCKTKPPYKKGDHSFKILAIIAPDKVTAASPWALRFVQGLKSKMGV
jgi:hypothetical protein